MLEVPALQLKPGDVICFLQHHIPKPDYHYTVISVSGAGLRVKQDMYEKIHDIMPKYGMEKYTVFKIK